MRAHGAPHNIEAEQALLGAILISNEALSVVERLIESEDFFEPKHQKIYGVAGDLISASKLATPVTLKNYLPADLDIDRSGAARGDAVHVLRPNQDVASIGADAPITPKPAPEGEVHVPRV